MSSVLKSLLRVQTHEIRDTIYVNTPPEMSGLIVVSVRTGKRTNNLKDKRLDLYLIWLFVGRIEGTSNFKFTQLLHLICTISHVTDWFK